MQRIEFSKSGNVVYHIDSDKKTVVAKIKCSAFEPQQLFDSQLSKHICGTGLAVVGDQWTFDYCVPKVCINSEYVGIAKCHPDDEFNEEFGKRLALIRAKKKYFNAIEKKMLAIKDWIFDLAIRTNDLYMNQYRKYIDCNSDLYMLLATKIGGDND